MQYYFVVGSIPEELYDKASSFTRTTGENGPFSRSLYRVIVVADWIVSARDLVRHHGDGSVRMETFYSVAASAPSDFR